MEWEIKSFERMGPIKFGMTPEDVAEILSPSKRSSKFGSEFQEFRELNEPVINYEDNKVSEIEAFYHVVNVIFEGKNIFQDNGREVMTFLEEKNGGALENVGTVLFKEIGITTGRLDQSVKGEHSITAFRKGYWDDDLDDFSPITFR